jgi:hypothetical protein
LIATCRNNQFLTGINQVAIAYLSGIGAHYIADRRVFGFGNFRQCIARFDRVDVRPFADFDSLSDVDFIWVFYLPVSLKKFVSERF